MVKVIGQRSGSPGKKFEASCDRLTGNIEGQGSHWSRSKVTLLKSHEGQGQLKGQGL